jgi:hypothetical protein
VADDADEWADLRGCQIDIIFNDGDEGEFRTLKTLNEMQDVLDAALYDEESWNRFLKIELWDGGIAYLAVDNITEVHLSAHTFVTKRTTTRRKPKQRTPAKTDTVRPKPKPKTHEEK